MMHPHDSEFSDSDLWRRFSDATTPNGPPPSPEELAGYLDGGPYPESAGGSTGGPAGEPDHASPDHSSPDRASPDHASPDWALDDLERRIADSPEALASLLAHRSAADPRVDDNTAPHPLLVHSAALAAARNLVSAHPEIVVPRSARPHRLAVWLQWSATAAAVVVVCGLAWQLGLHASPEPNPEASSLIADMSFGVLHDDLPNDSDLFILLVGETGEFPS